MALLEEDFNQEEHPDNFELLPDSDYLAYIIQSEIKDTNGKNGPGKRINFTFELQEGELAGRLVWAGVNFVNMNPQAQSMGRKELGNIARAAGVSIFSDTEELHYKHMIISVVQKTDPTGAYRPSNVIKAYRALENQHAIEAAKDAPAPAPTTRPAQTTAAAAPAAGAKPWQKKAA